MIIQEAKRKADNPSSVATETLFELLHDAHRIRRWRIGREEGLRKLTRDDLVRFYRNFYRPQTTILAIVGDIDLDDGGCARSSGCTLRCATSRSSVTRAPKSPRIASSGIAS